MMHTAVLQMKTALWKKTQKKLNWNQLKRSLLNYYISKIWKWAEWGWNSNVIQYNGSQGFIIEHVRWGVVPYAFRCWGYFNIRYVFSSAAGSDCLRLVLIRAHFKLSRGRNRKRVWLFNRFSLCCSVPPVSCSSSRLFSAFQGKFSVLFISSGERTSGMLWKWKDECFSYCFSFQQFWVLVIAVVIHQAGNPIVNP